MHVSIAPEVLFSIFGINITNTLLTAFIVVILLSVCVLLINRNLSFAKPTKAQLIPEMVFNYLSGLVNNLMGHTRSRKILGFLFTFFLLILVSNWFGLLPFVPTLVVDQTGVVAESEHSTTQEETPHTASIGGCLKNRNCFLTLEGVKVFEETKHILRAPTTDLSLTIVLAVLAVITINVSGLIALRIKYVKKFFNFSSRINIIVGLLELVSEFIKIISFSFRLFGNIFAGELLLTIITSLTYGLATLPFLFLEIFVGFIQSFVFFILLAIFTTLAMQDHSASEH